MKEKELDIKMSLMEFRRQLDDKEALVKESNMTHKLQEAEDAHLIAELRQRVASLEVQIQELVTTGQLNDENAKNFHLYNGISASTDKLDDLKFILMSSNTTLNNTNNKASQSDKYNYFKKLNGIKHLGDESSLSSPSTIPVNLFNKQHHLNNDLHATNTSASLASIPTTTDNNSTVVSQAETLKKTLRSHSEDAKKTDHTKLFDNYNNAISEHQNGDSDKEFTDDDLLRSNGNHIKTNIQSTITNSLS